MCYLFLLFHYLRELANAPCVIVFIYILLKQSQSKVMTKLRSQICDRNFVITSRS